MTQGSTPLKRVKPSQVVLADITWSQLISRLLKSVIVRLCQYHSIEVDSLISYDIFVEL